MNRKLLEEGVVGIFIVRTAILILEVQILENATIMRGGICPYYGKDVDKKESNNFES